MSPSKRIASFAVGFCVVAVLTLAVADEPSKSSPQTAGKARESTPRETAVQVLKPLGTLVGDWKGVGQPKRGSNVGAWSEKAQAAWEFDDTSATLVVNFDPGQQFRSAVFSVADDEKTALLTLTPVEGDTVELSRLTDASDDSSDKTWVFESSVDPVSQTRCTVRIISDIRMTILFEEKPAEKSAYRRLSEIGLTRAGSKLADGNTGERQCIVTGGLGTIKVSYEGKTYYVCCEGCKQAFDADPAGTLEAYRERLKEASKK